MPTKEELLELLAYCTKTWITQNGVEGLTLTGPNGNSIFLPAAGYRYSAGLSDAGFGYYWSSLLKTYDQYTAEIIYFNLDNYHQTAMTRGSGLSVRGVMNISN